MNINYRKTFGKRLKKMRLMRKMSQVELAEKAGLTSTVISHYESIFDKRCPGFKSIIALCDALDVTSDYLLGLSDDPFGSPIKDSFVKDILILSQRDKEFAKTMIRNLINKD